MAQRILVADDDAVIREIYLRVLGAKGYEVRAAKDGVEALSMLEDEEADLVLLDLEMPNLTGWEVLATMRNRAGWGHIPVIIVTNQDEPDRMARDAYPKYQCYVTKKQSGKELLDLVGQVLDAPESANSEIQTNRCGGRDEGDGNERQCDEQQEQTGPTG
jgi:CheY-like chemotaxis protein